MSNWNLLIDLEYKVAWDFIYETLDFQPYKEGVELINLPIPFAYYNISAFYDAGFEERLYDNLHESAVQAFIQISAEEIMYALNWQHECYSFLPKLVFEKDEFNEWLIPIFPNGDYLFFLTAGFKNGVFADGIHLTISLFGEDMIKAFEREGPEMLFLKNSSKETN